MHTTEQLNTALSGRYRIERAAGEGGMATVYVARDIRHNRLVALKVLKPELGVVLGPERFLTEIQVTANLHHPNLLPLFDSGEAGGFLYYVMPYIEGETLRQRLERERQFPVEEAVRLTVAIAGALDYAHRHNVIHRDLKPENVLLHEGQPLVMDFGIALAITNAGGARITQTGLSLGTPQYMSPEQATGDRQLDARTDIYSLAAMCYEMLSGDPPHTGSTVQAVIARVLTDHPRAIRASRSAVAEHIEAAVFQGLAKIPADRFATAAHFSEALTGARPVAMPALPSALSTATSTVNPAARSRWRPREVVAWGVAAGALTLAVAPMINTREAPPLVAAVSTIVLPESVVVAGTGVGGTKLALSRDGSQMLFVGARPGLGRAVYLRRLGDPIAEQVRGTDTAASPSFSPAGDWIVYNTTGGVIKKVPVIGGRPQVLTDSGGPASWGDDGRITFVYRFGLWVMSSDGTGRRRVAGPTDDGRIRSYAWPHVLPGGTHALITFRLGTGTAIDSMRLGVISLDDGTLTELDTPGVNAHYVNSGHIVYGRAGGELYAAPFSLKRRSVTGPATLLLQDLGQGTGGATGFAVAQNGTLVYHSGWQEPEGVTMFALSRDGRETALKGEERLFKEPRVSPDGRQIVVRIGPQRAARGDLWIHDIATGGLTRLTSDDRSVRGEWSRDGARVVFIRVPQAQGEPGMIISRPWDRAAPDSVLAAEPSSGSREEYHQVVPGPESGWSAIRRVGEGGNSDIYIAPTNSLGAMRPLISGASMELDPRVSPSGRLLAYTSNESGEREVYVVTIPDPGRRLPVSLGGGFEPMWSRDGGTLFYRNAGYVMAATIVERPEPAVTRRDSLFRDVYRRYGFNPGYDVLPDGRLLMVRRISGEPAPVSVFLVTNWQELMRTGARGDVLR